MGIDRQSIDRWLLRPAAIDSLVAFRFLFGLLLCAMMLRTLGRGWVESMYLAPEFHFTFPAFHWIKPGPSWAMYPLATGLAICGLGIAVGFFYRICATLFLFGFVYLELIDRAFYLNHYYLVSLLCILCVILPLHRKFSWDAHVGRVGRLNCVPAWMPYLLRFQLAVVYIFAAIAKMNHDWLFKAQPLRIWLPAASDLPLFGPWLNELWVAYAFSWFGLVYDLAIVFALLWVRTRIAAYATVIGFHVITWLLFPIGMFPWIMIVATTVFFPPDWPGKVRSFLRSSRRKETYSVAIESTPSFLTSAATWGHRHLPMALGVYCILQIAIPMRSWFIPGNSYWTGEGFDFGWRVMVAEKTGYVEFYEVHEDTGRRTRVDTTECLCSRQAQVMSHSPAMIRQFARHLGVKTGNRIHAVAYATFNGRRRQLLVRPDVDLTGELPNDWIIPLKDGKDQRAMASGSRF